MDFKRPNLVIGLLIVAVLGLATGLLQILKIVDILANLTDIWIFGIVAPAVGIATDLIIRGMRKPKPESLKIAEQDKHSPNIQVFTRKEIEPSFEKFLQEATHELVIIGASLHLSITGKEDIFRRLIEQKRLNLKFLILDPESKLVGQLERDLDWGLRGNIETTIASFERLKNKLSADLKEKLQMVFYNRIPIIGMIILDPESPKPTVQIVNYASGPDIGSRFAIQIRGLVRTDAILEKYLQEYQRFLSSSRVYQEKEFNPLVGKWG